MRLALAVSAGLLGAGSPIQVELVEEEVALVRALSDGRTTTVHRRELPAGTREGDVISHGVRDLAATERLRDAVRERLARRALVPRSEPIAPMSAAAGRGLTDEEEK